MVDKGQFQKRGKQDLRKDLEVKGKSLTHMYPWFL
jgi:hypothetical protein